jgi:hypothetical protein
MQKFNHYYYPKFFDIKKFNIFLKNNIKINVYDFKKLEKKSLFYILIFR